MRLYTGQGDKGDTSLWGKERASKASTRIDAIGAVDELNAALGLCIAYVRDLDPSLHAFLSQCQRDLFSMGAELAHAPASSRLNGQRIHQVEEEIDRLSSDAPPIRHFVLPGGSLAACHLHVARTIARRAERALVRLAEDDATPPRTQLIVYLNRLSDLLFAAARSANAKAGVDEPQWSGE